MGVKWRRIKRHRPVRFRRSDSNCSLSVFAREIELHRVHRAVEFLERAPETAGVDPQARRQFLHRIGNYRPAADILAAQIRNCFLIKYLVRNMPRLGQDRAPNFGVSVYLKVLSLVDKSFSLRVNHDAVRVRITRALIGSRLDVGALGVDHGSVTTAPVAEWE